MDSTRSLRTVHLLEQQYVACDDALHDALARIKDEEEHYDPTMLKLSVAMARITTQMANTIMRIDRFVGTKRYVENGGSKAQ